MLLRIRLCHLSTTKTNVQHVWKLSPPLPRLEKKIRNIVEVMQGMQASGKVAGESGGAGPLRKRN